MSRAAASAFSCAAACRAWCRGTATGRAAGSQRASESVEVKAGRAVRGPAWRVGDGHVAGLLAAQPVLVLLDLAEDGHHRDEQPGALERLEDGADGSAVLGPGGERRARTRGSAEPSSSRKPGSGMFLFATVTDLIGHPRPARTRAGRSGPGRRGRC
ncbi:hypothetical protein SGRIM128S_05042 [Streptomyces griseomycini]